MDYTELTDNNETENKVRIKTIPTTFNNGADITLPPASMTLYQWDEN